MRDARKVDLESQGLLLMSLFAGPCLGYHGNPHNVESSTKHMNATDPGMLRHTVAEIVVRP